jgi:hypothetical protein
MTAVGGDDDGDVGGKKVCGCGREESSNCAGGGALV